MNEVKIHAVRNYLDKRAFIDLPYRLYRDDPNWVPPLRLDMFNTLNPKKNALLRLGPYRYFLALQNGKPVGRLGVGIDLRLNNHKDRNLSYLTLFESIPEYRIAKALLDAGIEWLSNQGIKVVTGPQSPSNGDDYRGMLIKGYDSPPVFLNSYNPPYYNDFFTEYGFVKDFDRFAYYLDISRGIDPRILRMMDYVKKKFGVTVRSVNLKNVKEESLKMKEIIDNSMPEEWPDMVPPSLDEINAEVRKLLPLAVPELIPIVYDSKDRPIAFSVSIPNYNQVIKLIDGHLFPFGFIRFFLARKQIKGVRGFVIFVRPEWRKKGIPTLLYGQTAKKSLEMGCSFLEGSSIHEFNWQMNRDAQKTGAKLYKIYRVYKLEL